MSGFSVVTVMYLLV